MLLMLKRRQNPTKKQKQKKTNPKRKKKLKQNTDIGKAVGGDTDNFTKIIKDFNYYCFSIFNYWLCNNIN